IFYAIAIDRAGNTSGCSSGFTYVHDNQAPAAPSLTGTSPASPSDENHPTVSGMAEVGSTVRLYTTSNCSGTSARPAVHPARGPSAGPFGSRVPGADNPRTSCSGNAPAAAGNASLCSSGLAYTEVSPTISGTVTYTGGCTGRIYLTLLDPQNGARTPRGGVS